MSKQNKRLKRKLRASRKRQDQRRSISEVDAGTEGYGADVEKGWQRENQILHKIYIFGYLSFLALFVIGAMIMKRWPPEFDLLLGVIYWGITLAFVFQTIFQTAYTKEKIKGFFLVTLGSIFGQYIYLRGMAGATQYAYVHHSGDEMINDDLY